LLRQEKGPRRPLTPGQEVGSGTNTSAQPDVAGDRGAEAELAFDGGGAEALHAALDDEAADVRLAVGVGSLAQTTARSAMGLLVIQYLEPLST
jgi:hypothetical protein